MITEQDSRSAKNSVRALFLEDIRSGLIPPPTSVYDDNFFYFVKNNIPRKQNIDDRTVSIVRMYYGGSTLSQCGVKFGVTGARIRQIISSFNNKIKRIDVKNQGECFKGLELTASNITELRMLKRIAVCISEK